MNLKIICQHSNFKLVASPPSDADDEYETCNSFCACVNVVKTFSENLQVDRERKREEKEIIPHFAQKREPMFPDEAHHRLA